METKLIRELSTVNGFISRYFHHLHTETTQYRAYEVTESEHIEIFGRRRYADFNSFKIVKNRKIKG